MEIIGEERAVEQTEKNIDVESRHVLTETNYLSIQ